MIVEEFHVQNGDPQRSDTMQLKGAMEGAIKMGDAKTYTSRARKFEKGLHKSKSAGPIVGSLGILA